MNRSNVHLVFVLIQLNTVRSVIRLLMIMISTKKKDDDGGCEDKCVKEVGDIPQQVINSDETCCPSE